MRWSQATVVLLAVYVIAYYIASDAITYTPPNAPRWIHRRFNSRVLAMTYWPAVWSESKLRGLHISATFEAGTLWTNPVYTVTPPE